ncbi:MAG: DMT family transporter [Pseudomonadota bacterium]
MRRDITLDQQRRVGVVLVVLSALVFSTAGVFTKGVTADAWSVIFWRGAAAAGFTVLYLLWRGRLIAEARASKTKPAVLVAVLLVLGTAAFIPAFKLSSVANVALIYGAAPLVAALLSWIFISEPPTGRVASASVLAFAGVFIIFSASWGGGGTGGDLLALWMTMMMAASMVIYRRFPQTPAAFPAAVASLLLLPTAVIFGAPFEVPLRELPILIFFGLFFAFASVALSEGARRLPAAETALLSILELPLAPFLALLLLGTWPSLATLCGGACVLVAVLASQVESLETRGQKR